MSKGYLVAALLCAGLRTMAQEDTTATKKTDSIRIGSMVIVKSGGGEYHDNQNNVHVEGIEHYRRNVSTNWLIVDLGFANFNDKTDYAAAATAGVITPGLGKEKFKLRNSKSIDVNIWLFMQRLNLIAHVVNLKYGVGIELNNYRFEAPITYDKANNIFYQDMLRHYKKDKLAADYVTVPLMVNFNFTPHNRYNESFGFSAGISAGYLYSSRLKMITAEDGKQKIHDDMYLRSYKISYVAELQLGPVKLFGSMATRSMFEKGLDQTPYNIGLRLSNW